MVTRLVGEIEFRHSLVPLEEQRPVGSIAQSQKKKIIRWEGNRRVLMACAEKHICGGPVRLVCGSEADRMFFLWLERGSYVFR